MEGDMSKNSSTISDLGSASQCDSISDLCFDIGTQLSFCL